MDGLLTSKTSNTSNTNILGNTLQTADTTTYDPALRAIDPNKETVQGQLSQILKTGSPVIDMARAGADQSANARGLLNSSIAVGAGESAAIGAALPIAQADAGIYGRASMDNQSAKNTAGQFNAGETNATSRFNADELNQIPKAVAAGKIQGELSAQAATQAERLQTQRAQQEEALQTVLQTMRSDQSMQLQQVAQQHQQILNASSFANGLYMNIQQQIAAVLADPSSSPETKVGLVDKFTQQLRTGLAMIGGMNNIDINGLLDYAA